MTTSGTATPIPVFAPVERPPVGGGADDDAELEDVVVADVMATPVDIVVVGSNVVMKLVADVMTEPVAAANGCADVEIVEIVEMKGNEG